MACPSHTLTCPLCRLLLAPGDIATAPDDEYPTHYVCRMAHQEWIEEQEQAEQEREYRRVEEDVAK